ncbi:N-acetyl sugar amidotransferase [Candidatus Pelagibacter sp.]|nr:N-acetyl sugar amidotransferase [Candidatus Pelagibacter sp.]
MNNKIKYQQCKKCLYNSFHPLGIQFNENGICSGCEIHEEKNTLDWPFRLNKLKKIVKEYKSKKNNYDCIVPITGAQDSYYILHIVKNVLRLNPLLVNYNKYYNTPLGIHNLSNLRIKFDCDIIFKNVNPHSVKKITKGTLDKFGSIYWHCLAGHTVFPVQVASKMRIPLIIWGEHQGLQQVGMFSHLHEVEMTRRYRKDHDLMGYEAEDLIKEDDFLNESDLHEYIYPEDNLIEQIGIRGIYLGNYIRWDPKSQHEKMIKTYNFKSAQLPRTFDTYDYVDSYVYMGIHDILKYYKNGFSKVTDHACREIRYGRLNKYSAKKLIKKFENKTDNYINLFCNWLNIDRRSLKFILNENRNKNLWKEVSPNKWIKNNFYVKENLNQINKKIIYKINSNLIFKKEYKNNYITFDKGI